MVSGPAWVPGSDAFPKLHPNSRRFLKRAVKLSWWSKGEIQSLDTIERILGLAD